MNFFLAASRSKQLFLSARESKYCVSQPAESCMKKRFSEQQLRFVLLIPLNILNVNSPMDRRENIGRGI